MRAEALESEARTAGASVASGATSAALSAATGGPTVALRSAGLIVEDDEPELEPGQMRKTGFLAHLRGEVCAATDRALAGTSYSSAGCPYVEHWFGYYGDRSAADIERAIKRYVPEVSGAGSAADYVGPVTAKVVASVGRWASTGEVSGVPEDAVLAAGAATVAEGAGAAIADAAGAAAHGLEAAAGSVAGAASVLFKRRGSGPAPPADVAAVQARLHGGAPLDTGVRTRMEHAFGEGFGDVRIHTDATAGALADDYNAKALTVGSDVAFAAGEYRPGSLAGDVLIAHELAHTIQQRGGSGAPGAVLEQDADAAALQSTFGGRARVSGRSGLQLQRCNSSSAPPTPAPTPAPPPKPEAVFEDPAASTTAGAPVAFTTYKGLSDAIRRKAFDLSYPSGSLGKAMAALGRANAEDDRFSPSVQELARWVEEQEAQKAFGGTEAAMVTKQADFLKSDPRVISGGWGGTTKTRWGSLLPKAKAAWKTRGEAAIKKLVAHATSVAPELKLAESTFELEFEKIDNISLGALATGGSVPGKTLYVGFEFTAAVEVNPAYALSTVVHELYGHPLYDAAGGGTYGGDLYKKAAAEATSKGVTLADTEGTETYNYFQSEIYSLLKEIPYWTKVTGADVGKKIDVAAPAKTTPERLNYDPRDGIDTELRQIKKKWEPSVGVALLHGFYKRISIDPTMQAVSVTEFEKLVRKIFATADADAILK